MLFYLGPFFYLHGPFLDPEVNVVMSDEQQPVDRLAKFTQNGLGKVSKTKSGGTKSRKLKFESVGTPSQDIRRFFITSKNKYIPSFLIKMNMEIS